MNHMAVIPLDEVITAEDKLMSIGTVASILGNMLVVQVRFQPWSCMGTIGVSSIMCHMLLPAMPGGITAHKSFRV